MSADSKRDYRWLKVKHPDLDFWGIEGKLPWPAEDARKVEPKGEFPFARLLKGIGRLRAAKEEWEPRWAAIETFLQRGDALGDALERSDFPRALAMLEELEVLRPGTAYCAFNRAFILKAQGDREGALQAATLATERAPRLEHLWMRRGDLHVAVDVRVPTKLSKHAKKLLRDLETELGRSDSAGDSSQEA